MKILLIADTEERSLWDYWSVKTAERLSDVKLILSAGDLSPKYLEFLVTMMNVPLVYVRGNHDGRYESEPPLGCIDADGKLVTVTCHEEISGENGVHIAYRQINILGFGGSMRYKNGGDMYTEREMSARIRKTERSLKLRKITQALGPEDIKRPAFDILLTHAPCKDFGDMDDLPHTGFQCFNTLLNKYKPPLHCYGHVHKEYGGFVFGTAGSGDDTEGLQVKGYRRRIQHPSGTTLVNGSGHIILEI